jgi:MFS family permease
VIKQRHRLLAFLFGLAMITMVDRVCISVAGKSIQEDLGLSPVQWGWVLGSFSIAYGLLEMPGGIMGDRRGPRRVLTRIVILWSLFTALTGMARSFWQLVVVRFLFGAGEAGAYPNISVSIARWFPIDKRAGAQGFVWMASRLGGALSPLLVIPLQLAFGWRLTFAALGAVGFIWAVAWYLWFRDDPRTKRGITPEELAELDCPAVTASEPVPSPRGIFASADLRWIMAMYYSYSWLGYFYQGWLFTFLEFGRGYSKTELLRWSWLPFVCGAVANLAGGVAGDALSRRIGLKWGRRLIGIGGLAVAAACTIAAVFTHNKVLTIGWLALGYAASDFMMPMAWSVCLDVGGRRAGAFSGAMNMAGQAGGFSTSVAFGYVVALTGSYDAPVALMGLMTLLAAFCWLKIDATRRLEDSRAI